MCNQLKKCFLFWVILSITSTKPALAADKNLNDFDTEISIPHDYELMKKWLESENPKQFYLRNRVEILQLKNSPSSEELFLATTRKLNSPKWIEEESISIAKEINTQSVGKDEDKHNVLSQPIFVGGLLLAGGLLLLNGKTINLKFGL